MLCEKTKYFQIVLEKKKEFILHIFLLYNDYFWFESVPFRPARLYTAIHKHCAKLNCSAASRLGKGIFDKEKIWLYDCKGTVRLIVKFSMKNKHENFHEEQINYKIWSAFPHTYITLRLFFQISKNYGGESKQANTVLESWPNKIGTALK